MLRQGPQHLVQRRVAHDDRHQPVPGVDPHRVRWQRAAQGELKRITAVRGQRGRQLASVELRPCRPAPTVLRRAAIAVRGPRLPTRRRNRSLSGCLRTAESDPRFFPVLRREFQGCDANRRPVPARQVPRRFRRQAVRRGQTLRRLPLDSWRPRTTEASSSLPRTPTAPARSTLHRPRTQPAGAAQCQGETLVRLPEARDDPARSAAMATPLPRRQYSHDGCIYHSVEGAPCRAGSRIPADRERPRSSTTSTSAPRRPPRGTSPQSGSLAVR